MAKKLPKRQGAGRDEARKRKQKTERRKKPIQQEEGSKAEKKETEVGATSGARERGSQYGSR